MELISTKSNAVEYAARESIPGTLKYAHPPVPMCNIDITINLEVDNYRAWGTIKLSPCIQVDRVPSGRRLPLHNLHLICDFFEREASARMHPQTPNAIKGKGNVESTGKSQRHHFENLVLL